MTGKTKALMQQMSDQVLRFVEGVRREGGVRRVAFQFPEGEFSAPVVVIVLRQSEFEAIGFPESGKGSHKYAPQQMIMELCGWCSQPANHTSHAAVLRVLDLPEG